MAVDPTSLSLSIIGASETPADIFATASGGGDSAGASAQAIITSHRREINRIRGYKLQLTPADNERLAKIQKKIEAYTEKATLGTIREDELRARSELYREADRIIGKPTVDVEADPTLASLNSQINELLSPKLQGADAKRLEVLEKLQSRLQERLTNDPENKTVIAQFQNIARQIETLAPARTVDQLSESERETYDDLVRQVNEYADAKIMLDARESLRVYELQKSIDQLAELVPQTSYNQLTAARAASVYAKLG